ncbi:hypothetical protein STEG23_027770, partial [Scotinomys teguina]
YHSCNIKPAKREQTQTPEVLALLSSQLPGSKKIDDVETQARKLAKTGTLQ